MQTARIEFEIEIPDGVTNDELYEWLRFVLGENGRLAGNHPLAKHPLEAKKFTIESEILYN